MNSFALAIVSTCTGMLPTHKYIGGLCSYIINYLDDIASYSYMDTGNPFGVNGSPKGYKHCSRVNSDLFSFNNLLRLQTGKEEYIENLRFSVMISENHMHEKN